MADGDFVGATDGSWVFVGVGNRAEFDKIKLPVEDRGESRRWEPRVGQDCRARGVCRVSFQHWIKYRGEICAPRDI